MPDGVLEEMLSSGCGPIIKSLFLKKNFFKVYSFFRDRKRQSMSWEGAERKGTQNPKQAPGSQPDTGLELTNHEIMT